MSTPGPSSVELGIVAGFERAATFDLTPGPQGELFQTLSDVVEEREEAGPRSVAYFSEALTLASAARAELNQPPLGREEVRLAFSFWEWLFDGLIRR